MQECPRCHERDILSPVTVYWDQRTRDGIEEVCTHLCDACTVEVQGIFYTQKVRPSLSRTAIAYREPARYAGVAFSRY